MNSTPSPRTHRAWAVFAGMCVYYFVAYGLIYSGFGLFLPSMSQDLGIPYVQISATSTVRVLFGMITTALVGRLFPRVRLRRFLALSLAGLAGTILLTSISSSMWQFLPAFAAMGLFCGLTLYGLVPIILNQWFTAPAAYITIATACGGAGGIVLCPLLSQVIQQWGWRTGYHFMALMVLLVMLPIALVLFDFSPYAKGLTPLANHSRKASPDAAAESAMARSGAPIPQLLFWLSAAFFLTAALAGGMYIHISSTLYSKGFSPLEVSLLVSCFQAGTALLQFFPGVLSTRLRLRSIMNVALPLTALGAVALIFLSPGSPLPLTILMAALVGGGRMFTALNPLLARYAFGSIQFTQAYSRLQAIYLVGTAFTSILYGGIYSATGSYAGTLWLMAGCMAVLLILTQIIFTLVDGVRLRNGGTNHAV